MGKLSGTSGSRDTVNPTVLSNALNLHNNTSAQVNLVRESVEHLDRIENVNIDSLLDRIGNSRVILIGEATHGTSEFYRMRAEITKQLIEKKGFQIIAIEGDWPDVAQIHRYISGQQVRQSKFKPFSRFPTWMWRNAEVVSFLEWLRNYNSQQIESNERVGYYGLDLYSLFCSIDAVLVYLDSVDASTAKVARERYSCLNPWQNDPADYGYAAIAGRYRSCEKEVVSMLKDMLEKLIDFQQPDAFEYFDAIQNSRVIANAELYYRTMYYGGAVSWNLRDRHMFETLQSLMSFRGGNSKAIVWAHNSHIGNASATEMITRGEFNIGQLCRDEFGANAYSIGFGTNEGIVAAASEWGGEMEFKKIRPSHAQSYERICHETGIKAFCLPLREPIRDEVREELKGPLLNRAIGVIYRPETELQSHYSLSILPHQFDEYIWFDETNPVHPFDGRVEHGDRKLLKNCQSAF